MRKIAVGAISLALWDNAPEKIFLNRSYKLKRDQGILVNF